MICGCALTMLAVNKELIIQLHGQQFLEELIESASNNDRVLQQVIVLIFRLFLIVRLVELFET